MPGSALEFRCHSRFLFGLLQATAAKDTTAVAEPEVRIQMQVTDNQTQKRRSELGVRKSWPALKAICVASIMAAPNPCVRVHGTKSWFAAILLKLVATENPPLRFVAGSDCLAALLGKAEAYRREGERWRDLSVSTDSAPA